MSVNKITIKCPYCASILSIVDQPNLDNKLMKCPVCTKTSPFKSYIRMENRNSEKTEYQSGNTQTQYDKKTSVRESNDLILGELHVVNSDTQNFRLKMGKNIIGRKADSSKADFQISVKETPSRLSREHLIIDVNRVEGKGFVHTISLYKQQVNDTFVNNEKVYYGESLILHHGDVIKLPDGISIKFIISDSEGTMY